jgi:hypothetical protein
MRILAPWSAAKCTLGWNCLTALSLKQLFAFAREHQVSFEDIRFQNPNAPSSPATVLLSRTLKSSEDITHVKVTNSQGGVLAAETTFADGPLKMHILIQFVLGK